MGVPAGVGLLVAAGQLYTRGKVRESTFLWVVVAGIVLTLGSVVVGAVEARSEHTAFRERCVAAGGAVVRGEGDGLVCVGRFGVLSI